MRFVLFALALGLAACAPAARCAPEAPKPDGAIAEADAAFRKAVEAKDADAAAAFFAPEAPDLGEAMRQNLKTLAADPAGKATFRPTGAPAASADGDLAYTIGVLDWIATYPETKSALARSSAYIMVWRVQRDGAWKIVRMTSTETPYESPYRRYEN